MVVQVHRVRIYGAEFDDREREVGFGDDGMNILFVPIMQTKFLDVWEIVQECLQRDWVPAIR